MTKPPFILSDSCFTCDPSFETAIQELLSKYSIACEELTENQLASVFAQALASGDFIKQVRATDNAQNVIYIPYADVERLRSRVQKLEELLEQHGIEEPTDQ